MEEGIDLNARRFGFINGHIDISETALHTLCLHCGQGRNQSGFQDPYFKMVSVLLEKKANPNTISLDLQMNDVGKPTIRVAETALHLAIKIQNLHLVKLLMIFGANPDLPRVECTAKLFPAFDYELPLIPEDVVEASMLRIGRTQCNRSVEEAYKEFLQQTPQPDEESPDFVKITTTEELVEKAGFSLREKNEIFRLFREKLK